MQNKIDNFLKHNQSQNQKSLQLVVESNSDLIAYGTIEDSSNIFLLDGVTRRTKDSSFYDKDNFNLDTHPQKLMKYILASSILTSLSVLFFYLSTRDLSAASKITSSSPYLGEFASNNWRPMPDGPLQINSKVHFKTQLEDSLTNELIEVSTPNNPRYGNYLSASDIALRYGPSKEERKEVENYFKSIPFTQVESNFHGDLLISAEVQHIETTFNTKLALHSHTIQSDWHAVRAIKPLNIPAHISKSIQFISLNCPIGSFVSYAHHAHPPISKEPEDEDSRKLGEQLVSSTPDSTIASIRARYGIPATNHGLGSQAVPEFYGAAFSNKDLQRFFVNYVPAVDVGQAYIDPTHVFTNPDNPLPNDENYPDSQANMDVQYLMGLAPGISTYVYSMADMNPVNYRTEGFLEYLWLVGNQTESEVPRVHAISYFDDEALVFDESVPGARAWANSVEMQFAKMGLRGLTVIVAASDFGAGGIPESGQGRCQATHPTWPSSSPFVTSVGATMLDATGAEIPCSTATGGVFTTGGGFSHIHDRSSKAGWQSSVVKDYLIRFGNSPTTTITPATASPLPIFNDYDLMAYNPAGRGYPDLVVLGDNIPVVMDGAADRFDGTAAAAPIFAAMVSLWNDARLAANPKAPSMGFLNPFLYDTYIKDTTTFNDIRTGDNSCGTRFQDCCVHNGISEGLQASWGWDPVTGLGSPKFSKLANAALLWSGSSSVMKTLTKRPTVSPTRTPTKTPITRKPTALPTVRPTMRPTSRKPSTFPTTRRPTIKPSSTKGPTSRPK